MTEQRRQEMKEYKEKAMAIEHKLKGKRVSLDSGVMTTSTEIPKLEHYEFPKNVLKESVSCNILMKKKITSQNSVKTNDSGSPETPTLISEEEKYNLNDGSSVEDSVIIKSENLSSIENSNDNLNPKQELIHPSTVTASTDNEDNTIVMMPVPIPRLRSNSYTLSSPSPVMVAFLNSQVQQLLIEPKNLEKKQIFTKDSKSEPTSIHVTNECDNTLLIPKSVSLNSVPESFHNQELIDNNNLAKSCPQNNVIKSTDNEIILNPKEDEKESVATTIETNFNNDESVIESVITVFNGNSYENYSSPSSIIDKSSKHCCCKHSDDEYSLICNNMHFKTPEEKHREAERLRLTKLDVERRHQEELSNLIKKHREEQEQIAVRYYLVSQSTSDEMSLDGFECSETFSKTNNSSLQSGVTVPNDKSVLSDTSSIISNCSINRNIVCSSPRQKTPSRSPYLQQNIKFYHRMRGGLTSKWTKAPTEVENSAATIINSGVRGYLCRRLLRTEKAQLLKKTILDSLQTALEMHLELKKQQPTESDLELHRRIINQVHILILNVYLIWF